MCRHWSGHGRSYVPQPGRGCPLSESVIALYVLGRYTVSRWRSCIIHDEYLWCCHYSISYRVNADAMLILCYADALCLDDAMLGYTMQVLCSAMLMLFGVGREGGWGGNCCMGAKISSP